MAEEGSLEDLADSSVEDLREFIDTEQQFVKAEHALQDRLLALSNIISHLFDIVPKGQFHLCKLNKKVHDGITEILELIESDELKDLEFLEEEKHIKERLEDDVGHKDWRAVKRDIRSEEQEEKSVLRLEQSELRDLHSKFLALMKSMKQSLRAEVVVDAAAFKQKEEYEKREEYYFLQVYKFLRAYEKILRELWEKEKKVYRRLRNG